MTIPNSIITIGESAFSGCSGLTSVTIPHTVTSIGYYAFSGCSGLTEINCMCSIAPSLGENAFSGVTNTIPVNIPCESTASYLAVWTNFSNYIEPAPLYTMTVHCDNEIMGNANITTAPSCDNYITVITATANYGYHFAQWNDGNTDNPRTITLTQDTSFMAQFAKNQYTVNVAASDTDRGSVMGGGTVDYLDSVTVTATANYGYHFDHWDDGSTDNPHTIEVTHNNTMTAYFFPSQFSITVESSDETRGYVSGNGNYDYLSIRPISASSYNGYHFAQWNDGITDNPRTITLTEDTSFTAYFEPNLYTLIPQCADESLGTVSGAGTYFYLDTVELVATPIEHYHFVRWTWQNYVYYWYDESSFDNPLHFVVKSDATITAHFAIDTHTVRVTSNNIARGMVESTGTEFEYGTPCTVTATAYTGYTFAGWSNGVTANPYTFAVLSDVELSALFIAEGEEVYTVTVVSADPTMGSVSGGGQAMSGGEVTIRAISNPGYHFLRWNDNNTDSVRTVTVTANETYTAYFEANNVGIDDADVLNAKVFSCRGQIVVEGANDSMVTLYDVAGRVLASKHDEDSPLRFDTPTSGTYMIKVGNYPARKVVVIK